ncbi:hypothetical protein EVAR_46993_1 [Eumeta japonica]|uniref:Secreted protein n=1 Tax=Eumeta variegata TaxID=151549 RepID=A0A4C1X7B1_EUMVA|nr:hypothetical protein EVAR_46993_1 [Eumeta japonica]
MRHRWPCFWSYLFCALGFNPLTERRSGAADECHGCCRCGDNVRQRQLNSLFDVQSKRFNLKINLVVTSIRTALVLVSQVGGASGFDVCMVIIRVN